MNDIERDLAALQKIYDREVGSRDLQGQIDAVRANSEVGRKFRIFRISPSRSNIQATCSIINSGRVHGPDVFATWRKGPGDEYHLFVEYLPYHKRNIEKAIESLKEQL